VTSQHQTVSALSLLVKTDFLAFSNTNTSTMRIWDLSNEVEHTLIRVPVTSLLYCEAMDCLFAGSADGEIVLFCGVVAEDGEVVERQLIEIKRIKLLKGLVRDMWYHTDRDMLVVASIETSRGEPESTVCVIEDVFKQAMEGLDEKTKSSLNKDFEIVVNSFDEEETARLLHEMMQEKHSRPASSLLVAVEKEKQLSHLALQSMRHFTDQMKHGDEMFLA
jgi:hypothetical protein